MRSKCTTTIAIVIGICWFGGFLRAGEERAKSPETVLAEARQKFESGEGQAAIDLLEPLLLEASQSHRDKIAELLRESYQLEISRARTEKRTKDADELSENLAILSRPRTAKQARSTLEVPAGEAKNQVAPRVAAPSDPETKPASVAIETPDPTTRPRVRLGSSEAQRSIDRDPPNVLGGSSTNALGPRDISVSDSSSPSSRAIAKSLSESDSLTVKSVQPPRSKKTVDKKTGISFSDPERQAADKAFSAKRYEEAGTLYSKLASEKRLPANRIDHLCYCRCVAVVEKINQNPSTPAEWRAIRDELDSVKSVAGPNLDWPLKYIEKLINERTSKAGKPNSKAKRTKLRGQSPDEIVKPTAGSSRSLAPAAAKSSAVVPKSSQNKNSQDIHKSQPIEPAVGRASATIDRWQVWTTTNFRILHANVELAKRIAQVAEKTRSEQAKRWIDDKAAENHWDPICDIYVYPNLRSYQFATHQPEESPGFSTIGQHDGRIVARRINLHSDYPKLLTAVLPHELTHIVVADLFPDHPIPLWADEGIALLAEPIAEQRTRGKIPDESLRAGRLFQAKDLMTMDYPQSRHWQLYFAQSTTLTRYLVQQRSPKQFSAFLKAAEKSGYEPTLKSMYGIESFSDLDSRCKSYAKEAIAAEAANSAQKK